MLKDKFKGFNEALYIVHSLVIGLVLFALLYGYMEFHVDNLKSTFVVESKELKPLESGRRVVDNNIVFKNGEFNLIRKETSEYKESEEVIIPIKEFEASKSLTKLDYLSMISPFIYLIVSLGFAFIVNLIVALTFKTYHYG